MRTLRHGSCGADVRALRRVLNRLEGWPRLGDSPFFDRDTALRVKHFQETRGLTADAVWGPQCRAEVKNYFDGLWGQVLLVSPGLIVEAPFMDLRSDYRPRLASGQMDLKHLRGVTLHQTGCQIGDNPERVKKINAHFYISKSGKVFWLNDPRTFIWHAQGLSYFTLGIEIEGNYPGLIRDKSTLWKPAVNGGPDYLTKPMLRACDSLLFFLQNLFKLNKLTFDCVFAHRQSCASRANDPGENIWNEVGEDWLYAVNPDGAYQIKLMTFGSGRDIPPAWLYKSEK